MSLAHSPANDTRLADLMSEVREFGRLGAQGKDSLPMLAVKVAYAAADGVISTQKDADGVDDASKLYSEYLKAESKKAVHEHSAGGQKANASKLRQIITAASMPTCDFVDSLNKSVAKRTALLDAEVKCRPAYHGMVELARRQTAQADDLTDEQIEQCLVTPDPKEKTVEGELQRAEKILADLISGEKGLTCQEQGIIDAHSLIREQVAAFTLKRDISDTLAKAHELGLSIVPAVTPEGNSECISEVTTA